MVQNGQYVQKRIQQIFPVMGLFQVAAISQQISAILTGTGPRKNGRQAKITDEVADMQTANFLFRSFLTLWLFGLVLFGNDRK